MIIVKIMNPLLWIASLVFVTLTARRDDWKVDYVLYVLLWVIVFLRSLIDLLETL